MKTRKISIKKMIALIFALSIVLTGLFTLGKLGKTVSANEQTANSIFMPNGRLELENLSSAPIDVAYGEDIILSLGDNKILLSNGDGFISRDVSTGLKQVKNLDSEYFLACINGSVYKESKLSFKSANLEDNANRICGGNDFDINDGYLVTAFSTSLTVYGFNNGAIDNQTMGLSFTVTNNKPICINENNDIFYINGGKLCSINAQNLSAKPNESSTDIIPDKMIANGEYLYYISGNKIYKIDTALSGEPVELTVNDKYSNYDLGNLTNPSSIDFKDGNLLIGDENLTAVQEFSIKDNQLTFTGYAIANGKTAYNRISANAQDIERNGEKIAVLDDNKITLINNTDGYNGLSSVYFNDYFLDDFSLASEQPLSFALGQHSIMLGYSNSKKVKIIDLTTNQFMKESADENAEDVLFDLTSNGFIKDITYSNGIYYLVLHNGNVGSIISINEKTLEKTVIKETTISANLVCVDILGAIYFADDEFIYSVYNDSFKIALANDRVTKLSTDLSGNLYATDGAKLYYLDSANAWQEYALDKNVKSFCMGFDVKTVYFISDGDSAQAIYSTTALTNSAIDAISLPTEYILSSNNALISNLKLYTLGDNAVAFDVTKNQNTFKFNHFGEIEEEYVYICEVPVTDNLKMLALAGQNGIILVKNSDASEKDLITSLAPDSAYVTTAVNMYYLPIITMQNTYALRDAEIIRLTKGAVITPIKQFTAINREMYYASAEINGAIYYGYVPLEFTIETLAENAQRVTFTNRQVKACAVYTDTGLTNKLLDLADKTTVRLVSASNGVAEIYVLTGNVWVKGYILEDNLISNKNNTLRNGIIIITALTCVTITTAYFILKKKRK